MNAYAHIEGRKHLEEKWEPERPIIGNGSIPHQPFAGIDVRHLLYKCTLFHK